MLVDDLLARGHHQLTVLDLSAAALASARQRLGPRAEDVAWIEGDITTVALPFHAYDLWHDRAVFHFLTTAQQRQAYVQAVLHAVKPGGHVIVATFAEDGPTHCSGLPVVRYSPDGLHAEFGAPFTPAPPRRGSAPHTARRRPEVHLLRLPQGFTVTALPRPAKTTAPRRHRQWAWAVAALLLQLPATGMAHPTSRAVKKSCRASASSAMVPPERVRARCFHAWPGRTPATWRGS